MMDDGQRPVGKSWGIRGIRRGDQIWGLWVGDIFFATGFLTPDGFWNEDGGENERKKRHDEGVWKGGERTYEWMGGGERLDWVEIRVTRSSFLEDCLTRNDLSIPTAEPTVSVKPE